MTPIGALKKKRKYIDREVKTTFTRIMRPPIKRFQHFEDDKLSLIRSTTRFQNDFFQGLSPIDNPNYMKCNASTLHFNIEASSFNQTESTLTSTSRRLWKFTFKQIEAQKVRKQLLLYKCYSNFFFLNQCIICKLKMRKFERFFIAHLKSTKKL